MTLKPIVIETPIKRSNLPGAVVEKIREAIKRGDFEPGSKLPSIQELSNKLRVGRSSIREGLRQLQIVGIVTIEPGKGTFVREKFDVNILSESIGYLLTLHQPDVLHLMEARKIIERGTVALAAEKASEDESEKLCNLLERMKKELDNPDAFAKSSVQFHTTIAKASRNPLLPIFFNSVHELLVREQQAVASLLGISERSLEYHTRIWKAIKNHDVEKAVREMNNHLDFVNAAISKVL